MNKPLEEAREYAQKLAALLAALDDREDVPEGYEELDDEDYLALNDIAISQNVVGYDIIRTNAGKSVERAKAYNPGYRFYRKKAEERAVKYRYDHHIGLHDIGKEVQVRNTGEWLLCGVLDEIGNDTPNPYARFYRLRNNSLKWRHCRIEEAQ